jgi:hypothetical protein
VLFLDTRPVDDPFCHDLLGPDDPAGFFTLPE